MSAIVDRARLGDLARGLLRGRKDLHLGRVLRAVALGERLAPRELAEAARFVGTTFPDADLGELEGLFAASGEGARAILSDAQARERARLEAAFERGDGVEVAQRARAVLETKGELVHDDGRLWRCDSGVWRPVDDHEVDGVVMGFAGAPLQAGGVLRVDAGTVAGARRLLASLCARPGWFAEAPAGVAFVDRFVGRDGDEPLTPEHRCRAVHPFPWDPTARADGWRAFLGETYGAREAVGDLLAEFAGACLFGVATMFQRFVVLHGDGETGKSTVVSVLAGIMPAGTVGTIAPAEMRREYYRARLVGLRLNAVSEMPATELFETEAIKAIVSGDAVSARRPYESPSMIHPRAGHLFAANELPPVRDSSRGFWRRVLLISHDRVPPAKSVGLADALLEVELPGIVAWAIDGGRRAIARGAYRIPPELDRALETWRVDSDSVATWLRDSTDREGETPTADLYEHYRVATIAAGRQPVSLVAWGRRLSRAGVVPTRLRGAGRAHAWRLRLVGAADGWRTDGGRIRPSKMVSDSLVLSGMSGMSGIKSERL